MKCNKCGKVMDKYYMQIYKFGKGDEFYCRDCSLRITSNVPSQANKTEETTS